MLIARGTSGPAGPAGTIRKAGRRAAVHAVLGVALAVSLALIGTQAGLAGTLPGLARVHAAGPGWVLQAPPAPVSTLGGSLNGVSCASADTCMAVGDFGTSKGEAPFAESWNGTSWTLADLPTRTLVKYMYGVSCPSASSCIAVGATYNPHLNYDFPLAEIWNGTSWSAQSPPLPLGANSAGLSAVSCPSPDRCVAVGTYGPESFPFSESWNGTTWTAHNATLPGDVNGDFDGVSCRSYRSCVTVGGIRNSSGYGPVAASWNGRSWTAQSVPSPSGPSTDDTLQAVSCHSATDCMAVAGAGGPGAFQTLAEQWNGTAWTIVSMPKLGGAKAANVLSGVSCPRATRCTAVGDTRIRNKFRLLAEHWNGTRWQVDSTPEPPQVQSSAFGGVSCLPTRACIAVGSYYTHTNNTVIPLAEQHAAVQRS